MQCPREFCTHFFTIIFLTLKCSFGYVESSFDIPPIVIHKNPKILGTISGKRHEIPIFFHKNFFPKCSSGHVDRLFDNPAVIFLLKVAKKEIYKFFSETKAFVSQNVTPDKYNELLTTPPKVFLSNHEDFWPKFHRKIQTCIFFQK